MKGLELNKRQEKIVVIVKENGPITGEQIAEKLHVTRATLRPDLSILTMAGFLGARPRVGYYYKEKSDLEKISEELKEIQIGAYQSRPVVINKTMSAYDAICKMFDADVGTLFVVENDILAGVVSRKDLLRASIGTQDLTTLPVNVIMTRMPNISYCKETDAVHEVVQLLIDRQIDSLPVVKETERGLEITGRFTKTNIARVFLDIAKLAN